MKAQRFTSFQSTLKGLGVREHALESAQCKCLSKYIRELGAKSYVVEEDYTDPGFLLDYANYYSRCHVDMQKSTCRIHFFSCATPQLKQLWRESLDHLSKREVDREVNEVYLGFVVIKPLPVTIIGRTCLRTYPRQDHVESRTRHYPILRHYSVTLYGLHLGVSSIAFQEQDTEVAACATTAIWYAMHGLSKQFTTQQIPSPFEITNQGSQNMAAPAVGKVARKFPSSGLTVPQIDAYFRRFGLDTIVINLRPSEAPHDFLDCITAFTRGGAPIILLGSLHTSEQRDVEYENVGFHAMTILGFSALDGFKSGPWASRVARIFAHDDNVGPFSSFEIDRVSLEQHMLITRGEDYGHPRSLQPIAAGSERTAPASSEQVLTTHMTHLLNRSGLKRQGGEVYRRIAPYYLIIPIDAKVRFPYEIVREFAGAMLAMVAGDPLFDDDLSWSIQLKDVADFKREVRSARWLQPALKEEILHEATARRLWILRFTVEGDAQDDEVIAEFVFDATALRQTGGIAGVFTTNASTLGDSFLAAVVQGLEVFLEAKVHKTLVSTEVRTCLRRLLETFTHPE